MKERALRHSYLLCSRSVAKGWLAFARVVYPLKSVFSCQNVLARTALQPYQFCVKIAAHHFGTAGLQIPNSQFYCTVLYDLQRYAIGGHCIP